MMAKSNKMQSVKISELNQELKSWKINATVSIENKEVKIFKSGERSFKMFSVILEDKSGIIKGNAYDKYAERLCSKIRHNKKYCVSGAEILEAHPSNKTKHKFELGFRGNTEFKDAVSKRVYHLDDDHDNTDTESETETERRIVNFKPKTLSMLSAVRKFRDLPELKHFDILGIVTKTPEVEKKFNKKSSEPFFVKEVSILDETEGVNLSVTSDLKEKFEDFDWIEGMIIAAQGCYWKKLHQTNILSVRIEKVFKETELTESFKQKIKKLKTWYERKKKPCNTSGASACPMASSSNQESNEKPQANRPTTIKRSSEEEGYGASTSTLETEKPPAKKQKVRKRPSKEQEVSETNSSVELKWKKKCTSKSLKTVKEHAKLGQKTARIQICSGKEAHFGTGFRVGTSYLLTAFHVVEGVLEKMWKALYHDLSLNERKEMGLNEIKEGKSITKQLLPERGPWSVTEMFKHLDNSKRERLCGIAQQIFTDDVFLYFDFDDENSQLSSIKVLHDITFVSRSLDHDFVILQLCSEDQLPEKMFLQKFFIPTQCQEIILVGHPNGGFASWDDCKIMEEKDFEEWRLGNVTYFKNQEINDHGIIKEYQCLQFSKKKIFFHASRSMGGGCSGGPILTHDHNPKVIGFYHGGLPGALYNKLRWKDTDKMKESKPDAFIEMGIPTEVVAEALNADGRFSSLLKDIF